MATVTTSKRLWSSVRPALSESTMHAIQALGFTHMTPVQAATIPMFLSHQDVAVQACTGSGKTLAFVVPLVEMILRATDPSKIKSVRLHDVYAIVISPTRELATQIHSVLSQVLSFTPQFSLATFIGGTQSTESLQESRRNGCNVIVATPGRLESVLLSRSFVNTKTLSVLILDEADRLLDMGFSKSISNILSHLPKQRRTGLFSATQTQEVRELAIAGLRRPVSIDVQVAMKDGSGSRVANQVTPTTLQNNYMVVDPREKLFRLVEFLTARPTHKCVVFFLTCACVDYFFTVLSALDALKDTRLFSMHGKMVTKKRTGNLNAFTEHSSGVLLCTDVAARGIDIPDIDWIVQYDAPQDPSFFIHRIGRAARMGRIGQSVLFLCPHEDAYLEFLRLKGVPMVEATPPYAQAATVSADRVAAGAKTTCNIPVEAVDMLDEVKVFAQRDRDVMEKGQKAFVSYVRAYKEHKYG